MFIEPKIGHIINSCTKDEKLKKLKDLNCKLLTEYPVVYIHNWKDKNRNKYSVYIGETNDICRRTEQHYEVLKKNNTSWQKHLNNAGLYIIGHEHFNKSLTLDIENKLMLYLTSIDTVENVCNGRGNPQKEYYTSDEFPDIFSDIWNKLHEYNKDLFIDKNIIESSALFKASPFHKLTEEQLKIRNNILEKLDIILEDAEAKNKLIFVEGNPGTGKTVLNSSIFYELVLRNKEINENIENGKTLNICMLVNHDEQLKVYEQIIEKLGKDFGKVLKPIKFLNYAKDRTDLVDIVFVDEAHLLLTQSTQGYNKTNKKCSNMLEDIVKKAKVTIAMFDENQMLTTEQYLSDSDINKFRNMSEFPVIRLKTQLRINSSKEVLDWINNFIENGIINELPTNLGDYEIKFFDTPDKLDEAIRNKANNDNTKLSRLIATYDWNYDFKPKDISMVAEEASKYNCVNIGDWHMPWNNVIPHKSDKKNDAWAEQKETINEVGSTFTIQGFDLNYAGVILGPSIKYENGKIVYDTSKKAYDKMTRKRTITEDVKQSFAEKFSKNELRILMTRGVNGLYIYACDENLRNYLMKLQKNKKCILY